MKAAAILFTDLNKATCASIEIPDPKPGEVLIQSTYTLISPGTELRCLSGKQPNSKPYPYIPGYSLVGTVVAQGEGVMLPIGTRVFCGGTIYADRDLMWGGHVSYAVQSEANVYRIPDNVSFSEAAIAKLTAISYHGLRLSQPRPDELVAVLGLGVIGQLASRLYQMSGAHVVAIDLIAERLEIAQKAGLETMISTPDLVTQFNTKYGCGADIVVDSTGAPKVIATAVELAKSYAWNDETVNGARLVVQGSYPDTYAIPYQASFEKELTILTPRDTQRRDIRTALELMSRGKIAVQDLITAICKPDDAHETYRMLREDTAHTLTFAFDWRA